MLLPGPAIPQSIVILHDQSELGVGQLLVPGIHEHHRRLVLVGEDAESPAGSRIASGLDGKGRVVALQDETELGDRPFFDRPEFNPAALDDATTNRGRSLLKLPGRPVFPEVFFQLLDDGLRKSLRPVELADLRPRIVRTENGLPPYPVELNGDHNVSDARAPLLEQVTSHVLLVSTLHNHNFCVALLIVQPRGHSVIPPIKSCLSLHVTEELCHVVRVVVDDSLPALACSTSPYASSDSIATLVVLVARFRVLIAC